MHKLGVRSSSKMPARLFRSRRKVNDSALDVNPKLKCHPNAQSRNVPLPALPCLNVRPLHTWPFLDFYWVRISPQVGLEPTTLRLAIDWKVSGHCFPLITPNRLNMEKPTPDDTATRLPKSFPSTLYMPDPLLPRFLSSRCHESRQSTPESLTPY